MCNLGGVCVWMQRDADASRPFERALIPPVLPFVPFDALFFTGDTPTDVRDWWKTVCTATTMDDLDNDSVDSEEEAEAEVVSDGSDLDESEIEHESSDDDT